ncbi:MAG: hypothetical protein FJ087_23345 [Deltaproteobacteria bacterium]|nr:hypothetical protein [Deltaproteobacteria bacterium]
MVTGRHPGWPERAFVTASGSSREGPRAAELAARAEVCRQVRSSIRVTTEDEQSFAASGAGPDEVSRFVQKAVQSASCDFGELIRIAADLSAESGGTWWAFAALPRSEAVRAIEPDFDRDATAFRERARAALAATGDVARFAADYGEAQRAFDRALPRALEIRSLAGEYGPVRDLFATEARLLAAAAAVRAATVVTVVVDAAPDAPGLARGLVRWIEAAGVRAAAGATCRDGVLLKVSAVEECSTRLDVCCSWTLSGSLCDCAGRACVPAEVPAPRGCHRNNAAEARRELMSAIGAGSNAASSARAALSAALPLPPEP